MESIWPDFFLPQFLFDLIIYGENGGTLGMIPSTIYTVYSGHLLGISSPV